MEIATSVKPSASRTPEESKVVLIPGQQQSRQAIFARAEQARIFAFAPKQRALSLVTEQVVGPLVASLPSVVIGDSCIRCNRRTGQESRGDHTRAETRQNKCGRNGITRCPKNHGHMQLVRKRRGGSGRARAGARVLADSKADSTTLYDLLAGLLGVQSRASAAEIKKAYYRWAKSCHACFRPSSQLSPSPRHSHPRQLHLDQAGNR